MIVIFRLDRKIQFFFLDSPIKSWNDREDKVFKTFKDHM